ncbi:MAG: DUF4910 domain-containing protein [Asgard group archaeon]|nr:DUF4910 domain-containing protein [Asgard group archaeon]
MFKKIYDSISKEFSGTNAKELVGGIANFHRIQSSPGFRDAAKYCSQKAKDYGLSQVKILTYPATGNNSYWGCPVPKEWSIKDATLKLIEPKENEQYLCRFFENPCSIIQRSRGTSNDGIIGEVVILPKELEEDEMKNYDLKDKFVLTDDSNLKKLRLLAINRFGAAGIIYDLVTELKPFRTRENFPTARRYTSFWYGTQGDEGDALGFVLSAEQGNSLRKLIKKTEKENEKLKEKNEPLKKVKVHAKIDANFYDGEMEVVEFFIPGKEKGKEVIAVAHLCHPKPGAIDNASGCGTILEVARTLSNLIKNGELEQPKRGIRFLLVAEYTGSYCYLATHEDKIENFVAGINLDMVGADQTIGGGRTLIMERTHDSYPSYVNDVLSAILHEASKEVINFTNTGAIATFKYANDQPFSGGSDHAVFGYHDVGIGTPMFIQWPDRYYHTGEDTLEKVSPEMLKLVGLLAATYCYFIANADMPDLFWIAHEVGTKGRERLIQFSRDFVNSLTQKIQKTENKDDKEHLIYNHQKRIDGLYKFKIGVENQTLNSLLKLTSNDVQKEKLMDFIKEEQELLHSLFEKELKHVNKIIENLCLELNIKSKAPKKMKDEKALVEENLIPEKIYRGPITSLARMNLNYEEIRENEKILKDNKELAPVFSEAIFWINGKRTIKEIAELVENLTGKMSIPLLIKLMKIYEKENLIKLKKISN